VCSLGVTLHHVPDVASPLDVSHGHAADARSVLAARLALVGTGIAVNLGANSHRDRGQVGVPRGYDGTTWVTEKLRLGVVRRTRDEFTAVRNHNNATLGVEKNGRGGHFRIDQGKKLAALLILAASATLRPPPGTRAPWVIRVTRRTHEDRKKQENDDNNQECLGTGETCHLRSADKINPWMNLSSIYPKNSRSN